MFIKQYFHHWPVVVLFIIFLLAVSVRIWNVGANPTLISDEASIGYNAYSVLNTGKDEWGSFLPLSFKSFGEYKLPLYIYLTVPSVAVFGLNEFSTRFPSILFGSMTVLLVYFLTREILPHKQETMEMFIGIMAGLFLAINPWHIQLSRMSLEVNLSIFLSVLAALLLLKAKIKPKWYYLSLFLFALTIYTYNSSRVFTPIFLLGYFFFERKNIPIKEYFKPVVLFILLLLPVFLSGFSGSKERLYKVGIFSNPGLVAQINEERGKCQESKPQGVCALLYNKPLTYTLTFTTNYFSHFSWKFLFSEGSGFAQYGVPGQGQLYYWELPFLLVGLAYFYSKSRKPRIYPWMNASSPKANQRNSFCCEAVLEETAALAAELHRFKKSFFFLLLWLFASPIANSVTGTAHPLRAGLMLPIFQILSAVGLVASLVYFSKRTRFKFIYSFLLILVIIASFAAFVMKYFAYYPVVAAWNWQSGYKELFQQLSKLEPNYDRIYVSKFYGEPHIFYLFYSRFDPKLYQQNKEVERYDREDLWVNVDRIGKYYFVQEPQKVILEEKQALALPLQEYSFDSQLLGKVQYQNGQTAFLILRK